MLLCEQGRRSDRRPCDLFQRRQRGNDFLCRRPYPFLILLNVLQICFVDAACFVGAAGELEHGALWHVPGGYAMRELLGWKGDRNAYAKGQAEEKTGQPANALSIVPSTKKVGGPGAALDVPLTHINASYVRSHFDAIEVRVPGAPSADEIVFILAMTTGPRIHARVGGLKAAGISQWNGLR